MDCTPSSPDAESAVNSALSEVLTEALADDHALEMSLRILDLAREVGCPTVHFDLDSDSDTGL